MFSKGALNFALKDVQKKMGKKKTSWGAQSPPIPRDRHEHSCSDS